MSKAEDKALKIYPVVMTTLIPADNEHPLIEQDCNKFKREAFIKGYHQAEKDTIEKAAKWLKNNLEDVVGGSIYIEDFLKAMRDE